MSTLVGPALFLLAQFWIPQPAMVGVIVVTMQIGAIVEHVAPSFETVEAWFGIGAPNSSNQTSEERQEQQEKPVSTEQAANTPYFNYSEYSGRSRTIYLPLSGNDHNTPQQETLTISLPSSRIRPAVDTSHTSSLDSGTSDEFMLNASDNVHKAIATSEHKTRVQSGDKASGIHFQSSPDQATPTATYKTTTSSTAYLTPSQLPAISKPELLHLKKAAGKIATTVSSSYESAEKFAAHICDRCKALDEEFNDLSCGVIVTAFFIVVGIVFLSMSQWLSKVRQAISRQTFYRLRAVILRGLNIFLAALPVRLNRALAVCFNKVKSAILGSRIGHFFSRFTEHFCATILHLVVSAQSHRTWFDLLKAVARATNEKIQILRRSLGRAITWLTSTYPVLGALVMTLLTIVGMLIIQPVIYKCLALLGMLVPELPFDESIILNRLPDIRLQNSFLGKLVLACLEFLTESWEGCIDSLRWKTWTDIAKLVRISSRLVSTAVIDTFGNCVPTELGLRAARISRNVIRSILHFKDVFIEGLVFCLETALQSVHSSARVILIFVWSMISQPMVAFCGTLRICGHKICIIGLHYASRALYLTLMTGLLVVCPYVMTLIEPRAWIVGIPALATLLYQLYDIKCVQDALIIFCTLVFWLLVWWHLRSILKLVAAVDDYFDGRPGRGARTVVDWWTDLTQPQPLPHVRRLLDDLSAENIYIPGGFEDAVEREEATARAKAKEKLLATRKAELEALVAKQLKEDTYDSEAEASSSDSEGSAPLFTPSPPSRWDLTSDEGHFKRTPDRYSSDVSQKKVSPSTLNPPQPPQVAMESLHSQFRTRRLLFREKAYKNETPNWGARGLLEELRFTDSLVLPSNDAHSSPGAVLPHSVGSSPGAVSSHSAGSPCVASPSHIAGPSSPSPDAASPNDEVPASERKSISPPLSLFVPRQPSPRISNDGDDDKDDDNRPDPSVGSVADEPTPEPSIVNDNWDLYEDPPPLAPRGNILQPEHAPNVPLVDESYLNPSQRDSQELHENSPSITNLAPPTPHAEPAPQQLLELIGNPAPIPPPEGIYAAPELDVDMGITPPRHLQQAPWTENIHVGQTGNRDLTQEHTGVQSAQAQEHAFSQNWFGSQPNQMGFNQTPEGHYPQQNGQESPPHQNIQATPAPAEFTPAQQVLIQQGFLSMAPISPNTPHSGFALPPFVPPTQSTQPFNNAPGPVPHLQTGLDFQPVFGVGTPVLQASAADPMDGIEHTSPSREIWDFGLRSRIPGTSRRNLRRLPMKKRFESPKKPIHQEPSDEADDGGSGKVDPQKSEQKKVETEPATRKAGPQPTPKWPVLIPKKPVPIKKPTWTPAKSKLILKKPDTSISKAPDAKKPVDSDVHGEEIGEKVQDVDANSREHAEKEESEKAEQAYVDINMDGHGRGGHEDGNHAGNHAGNNSGNNSSSGANNGFGNGSSNTGGAGITDVRNDDNDDNYEAINEDEAPRDSGNDAAPNDGNLSQAPNEDTDSDDSNDQNGHGGQNEEGYASNSSENNNVNAGFGYIPDLFPNRKPVIDTSENRPLSPAPETCHRPTSKYVELYRPILASRSVIPNPTTPENQILLKADPNCMSQLPIDSGYRRVEDDVYELYGVESAEFEVAQAFMPWFHPHNPDNIPDTPPRGANTASAVNDPVEDEEDWGDDESDEDQPPSDIEESDGEVPNWDEEPEDGHYSEEGESEEEQNAAPEPEKPYVPVDLEAMKAAATAEAMEKMTRASDEAAAAQAEINRQMIPIEHEPIHGNDFDITGTQREGALRSSEDSFRRSNVADEQPEAQPLNEFGMQPDDVEEAETPVRVTVTGNRFLARPKARRAKKSAASTLSSIAEG